jgi:N-acetylglucosamine-6-sulfatase
VPGHLTARIALIAAAATLALGATPAPAGAVRPNVVVIETDDQTAASIWAMPTVKRLLADRGVTFDNSFVSYALCCPSRATFLTGQYAHNHNVFANGGAQGGYYKLRGKNTLPVWLRAAGYRTIHVGRYLNDYGRRDPLEVPPGWSDWHGLVDPYTHHYYGFKINENGTLHSFAPTPENYQTAVLTRKAVNLIGRASRAGKPFFMWAAYPAPHYSFDRPHEPDDPRGMLTPVPAPSDRNTFATEPLPMGPSFNELDVSDKPVTVRQFALLTEEERAAIQENYQQELETLQAVDRGVGRIVDALRESGQLGRTLMVFTSDNGYYHGEHRVPNEKTLPYEPGIRVPLVIRGPGLPRAVHQSQLVSNQDLASTILDAAGAKAGLPQDGLSLMPLMRQPELEPGRDLLVEGSYPFGRRVRFAGVRTYRWFYAEYSDPPSGGQAAERELYDLIADPDELTSLDSDPAYASVEADLARRLAKLRKCRGKSCLTRPAP